MAGLQYKNRGDTQLGYSNGIESGEVNNWTNVSLSGSHTMTAYWDDSDNTAQNTASRVKMTVKDSWTGTINSDNSITLNITSSFEIRREVWKDKACSSRVIGVFPGSGYNDTILYKFGGWNISTGGTRTGSRSWTLTLAHGQSREIGSFYVKNLWEGGCGTSPCSFSSVHPTEWECPNNKYTDIISAGSMFRNTLPAPPVPPTVSLSCGIVADTTNGEVKSSVSDYGCPSGNSCSNSHSVVWSTSSTYSPVVATGTGVKGLLPNTKYYVKATASNGSKSTSKTCSFTTLASSYPYAYKYVSDQVSRINIQINNGSDACDIETKLYIREVGASSWTLITTTTEEKGFTQQLRNLIQRGKTYEAKTETKNCAGTYHSAIYTFAPPAADGITGQITKTNASLEASGLLADVDYCYKVTSYTLTPVSASNPMTSHLEYRPEGQTDWVTTDTVTSTSSPATICDTLTGLLCGTEYEFRTFQQVGSVSSYSAVVKVAMPLCADVNNCVCENLNYVTELICQTLNRIKTGDKQIYANCPTKELCDPYSENPTLVSILSRIVRYSQMVACLLCSMDAMTAFGAGEKNQVYTATEPGKFGSWIDLEDKATEDSDNLISSGGAYDAINTMLNSVLRPIGTYTYYAESLEELRTQASSPVRNETAIIGDSYYTYGTSWTRTGKVPHLQDLGVVNILKGGWAQREFYWWNDKWNLIDLDPKTEPRITALEQGVGKAVLNYNTTNEENMMVAPINYTDAQLVTLAHQKYGNAREVVVYLTDGSLTASPFILDVSHLDGADVLS